MLSAQERQVLAGIAAGLEATDPRLAERLTVDHGPEPEPPRLLWVLLGVVLLVVPPLTVAAVLTLQPSTAATTAPAPPPGRDAGQPRPATPTGGHAPVVPVAHGF